MVIGLLQLNETVWDITRLSIMLGLGYLSDDKKEWTFLFAQLLFYSHECKVNDRVHDVSYQSGWPPIQDMVQKTSVLYTIVLWWWQSLGWNRVEIEERFLVEEKLQVFSGVEARREVRSRINGASAFKADSLYYTPIRDEQYKLMEHMFFGPQSRVQIQ